MIEHASEGCECNGHKCTKCEKVKCRGFFHPRHNVKSGLASQCNQCTADRKREKYSPEKRRAQYEANLEYEQTRNREYARANKEQVNERSRKRYQENKEYELARRKKRHEVNKDHENAMNRQWREENHEQALLTSKRWREENKDRHNELSRAWNSAHPERVRENVHNWRSVVPGRVSAQHSRRRANKVQAGGSYTAIEWEDLKASCAYTCLCCGRREPEITLTADHVVPVTKNGSSDIWNIQPLCKSCNSSKGTKIIDYRQERDEA